MLELDLRLNLMFNLKSSDLVLNLIFFVLFSSMVLALKTCACVDCFEGLACGTRLSPTLAQPSNTESTI